MIISLGEPLLGHSSSLPGRIDKTSRLVPVKDRTPPCLTLLPVRFAWPKTLLPPPVVSYTTVSPSPPVPKHPGQCTSLLHLLSGRPARPLAGTVPYGVRTFLEAETAPRSPNQPDKLYPNIGLMGRQARPVNMAFPKSDFLALCHRVGYFPPPLSPPPGAGNFSGRGFSGRRPEKPRRSGSPFPPGRG